MYKWARISVRKTRAGRLWRVVKQGFCSENICNPKGHMTRDTHTAIRSVHAHIHSDPSEPLAGQAKDDHQPHLFNNNYRQTDVLKCPIGAPQFTQKWNYQCRISHASAAILNIKHLEFTNLLFGNKYTEWPISQLTFEIFKNNNDNF